MNETNMAELGPQITQHLNHLLAIRIPSERWRYSLPHEEDRPNRCAIVGKCGRRIILWIDADDRLNVRGDYPATADNDRYEMYLHNKPDAFPKMSTSPFFPPENIARSMIRRFVLQYNTTYDALLSIMIGHAESYFGSWKAARLLKSMWPPEIISDLRGDSFRIEGNQTIEIDIDDAERVSIKVGPIAPSHAVEICEFLRPFVLELTA